MSSSKFPDPRYLITAPELASRLSDITLIDPALTWRVDAAAFASKSVNSPFHGWTLQGRAVATIVAGRVKYRLGRG